MSEVERYLDEMFDRLAGTGAAGRRALAETEDHLRAAVAAGLAEGLPDQQAEHEAVIRFGSAARIAGQVVRVHRRGPVRAAASAAWLVVGVGLSWLGVMFLAETTFTGLSREGGPASRPAPIKSGQEWWPSSGTPQAQKPFRRKRAGVRPGRFLLG